MNNILWVAAAVAFVNGSSTMGILLAFSGSIWAWVWYVAVSITIAYISTMALRRRGSFLPERISGKSLKRGELALLIFGLLWGSAIYVVPSHQANISYFVFMVNVGMATGFSAITAASPRLSMRFAIPCLITNSVYFVVAGNPMGLAMAGLIFVLLVALFLGGVQSERQLVENINSWAAAKQARSNLIDAIEAVEDGFAIHGADGSVEMANSQFRHWFKSGVLAEKDARAVRQLTDGTWVKQSTKPLDDGRSVSIHTDVTALKLREQQLIAARREAEEANEAKGRFMSTMSHELRTPLNIIIGFSKIMSTDSRIKVSENDMRDYANSIHDAGAHLLTVINDIIEFSRVGQDRYMHEPIPLDLSEQLAHAISLAARFNRVNDLKGLDISISPKLGAVIVDEAAFRRILINLVGNAMKFGGSPVKIAIRAFLDDSGCPVITIRDFGPGLAKSDLDRVFEPFFQSEADRGGEFSGTGLGLPLSRELARLHGGDVTLSSRPGAGATATIILPVKTHIAPRSEGKAGPAILRPVRAGAA
ncbi:MAG: HAMP domain-containing sensor histidine kinase [Pseudomonadota bacterium]